MIIHVFTADRFHLVPNILKGFLRLEESQFFILARNINDDRDLIYIDIFKDFHNVNYKITHSFDELRKVSNSFKDHKVILHGVPYQWMVFYHLNGFTDVNWVCWGAGASINRSNWKSILFTPFKKMIYRRFKRVAVLMPQDGESLEKDFGIKHSTLLIYFGNIDSFPYTMKHLSTREHHALKRVYLGNNSNSVGTYLPLSKTLSKFKGNIFINCMINYSFKETEQSINLRELGESIYGDNFKMDTKLYPLQEYYEYMNKCDIYICGVKGQSGLGAIFTCLRLGKKVFLTGVNYEFINSLGAIIYRVEDLEDMQKETFFTDLTYEEKVRNYEVIDDFLNKDKVIKKWEEFFHN